jgi:hypothetical protein
MIDVCKTQLNSATSAADMTEIGDCQVVEGRCPSDFSPLLLLFEGSDYPLQVTTKVHGACINMFYLHCGAMVWYCIAPIFPCITYIVTLCIYGDGVAEFILS